MRTEKGRKVVNAYRGLVHVTVLTNCFDFNLVGRRSPNHVSRNPVTSLLLRASPLTTVRKCRTSSSPSQRYVAETSHPHTGPRLKRCHPDHGQHPPQQQQDGTILPSDTSTTMITHASSVFKLAASGFSCHLAAPCRRHPIRYWALLGRAYAKPSRPVSLHVEPAVDLQPPSTSNERPGCLPCALTTRRSVRSSRRDPP